MDKSGTQSGPYGFAKRSLLTAQHPRLKRDAGLEGTEAVPTPNPSVSAAASTPGSMVPSASVTNKFGSLRSANAASNIASSPHSASPGVPESKERNPAFLQRAGAFEQKTSFAKGAGTTSGGVTSRVGLNREPSVSNNEATTASFVATTHKVASEGDNQGTMKPSVSFSAHVSSASPANASPPPPPVVAVKSALKSNTSTGETLPISNKASSSTSDNSPQKEPLVPPKVEESPSPSPRPSTPNSSTSHNRLLSKYGNIMKKAHHDSSNIAGVASSAAPSPATTDATKVVAQKADMKSTKDENFGDVGVLANNDRSVDVGNKIDIAPSPAPTATPFKKISLDSAPIANSYESASKDPSIVSSVGSAISTPVRADTRKPISILFDNINLPEDDIPKSVSSSSELSHTQEKPAMYPPVSPAVTPLTVLPPTAPKLEHSPTVTAVPPAEVPDLETTPIHVPQPTLVKVSEASSSVSTPPKPPVANAPTVAVPPAPVTPIEKKVDEEDHSKKPSTASKLLSRFYPQRRKSAIGKPADKVLETAETTDLSANSIRSSETRNPSSFEQQLSHESIVQSPSKPNIELVSTGSKAADNTPVCQTDELSSAIINQDSSPVISTLEMQINDSSHKASGVGTSTSAGDTPSPTKIVAVDPPPPPPIAPLQPFGSKGDSASEIEKSAVSIVSSINFYHCFFITFSLSLSFIQSSTMISSPNNNEKNDKESKPQQSFDIDTSSEPAVKGSDEHFDVDYQMKSDIPRAIFKSPSTKDVDEEHESNKLNHYSKLGSAFANNALRTGGAGRGRGRGRGIQ